ncbi:MAG: methylmalonyl-CoA carboxyltransferase [Ruminococcaceae bacterium]|nr:methylmalonyl-CoA carboxyltransferase [Oscillospiraceae bacterium]
MDNLEKLKLFREMVENKKTASGSVSGKKSAKERLEMLFDDGTFIETDSFLKSRNVLTGETNYADGVIAGYGTVMGKLVYAYAQDFGVLNGSISEMNCKKIAKVYDAALKTGAPIVSVIDCGGIRLDDGLDALCSYNEVMKKAVDASGLVPQISVVLGVCAGSMTFIPAISDFSFIVDKQSEMYITSKEVLKGVNNEDNVDFASASFNGANGSCEFVAKSEEDAFLNLKKLLGLLPSNNFEQAEITDTSDDFNRATPDIINIIPSDDKSEYDVKDIIKSVADNFDFMEVSETYAKNMVTGFIKLGGITVGVVANQPNEKGGVIDNLGAKKAADFITKCDSFNIPVLSFTDSEGFELSLEDEKWGMIKDVAKLGYAFASSTVAKVNVVLRKSYGAAYLYMNSKQMGADLSYALPTAVITATTPEVALNMLYADEIKKYDDPKAGRIEIMNKYKDEVASPYEAAKRGYIDDVVDPEYLRPVLVSAFDVLLTKREDIIDKKHGNMPL